MSRRKLLRRIFLIAAIIISILSTISFMLPTLIRTKGIGIALSFFLTQNKLLLIALTFILLGTAFYIKWKDKGHFKLTDFKFEIISLLIVIALIMMSSFLFSRAVPFVALDNPKFVSVDNAFMNDDDFIMGVSLEGISKAYPLTMMAWHHIINDEINGRPIAITYCPICNSGITFESEIDENILKFDVETNYRANMVMVDRQTGSWWQQVTGEAIQGKMLGTVLKKIPADIMTLKEWKVLHPNTLVLSKDTGFDYNYNAYPWRSSYRAFQNNDFLPQPLVKIKDMRFRAKETVLGVQIGDIFKAYPFSNLGEASVINDEIDGEPVLVLFENESQIASAFSRKINGDVLTFKKIIKKDKLVIRDENTNSVWDFEGRSIEGKLKGIRLEKLNYHNSFWFAWVDFHPDTLVYEGE